MPCSTSCCIFNICMPAWHSMSFYAIPVIQLPGCICFRLALIALACRETTNDNARKPALIATLSYVHVVLLSAFSISLIAFIDDAVVFLAFRHVLVLISGRCNRARTIQLHAKILSIQLSFLVPVPFHSSFSVSLLQGHPSALPNHAETKKQGVLPRRRRSVRIIQGASTNSRWPKQKAAPFSVFHPSGQRPRNALLSCFPCSSEKGEVLSCEAASPLEGVDLFFGSFFLFAVFFCFAFPWFFLGKTPVSLRFGRIWRDFPWFSYEKT